MTTKNRKKHLTEKLASKKYRDAFVTSYIDQGIPFQIKALREQRDWTQEQLAEYSRMAQTRISLLENPNNKGITLKTLKALASAFDVGLIVRFVPYGDIVHWDLALSSESLRVPSFKDDPYFKEEDESTLSDENQYVINTLTDPSKNVTILQEYKLSKALSTTSEETISEASAMGV